jgi:TatA/E family protein of Tat protein translocase
MDIGVPELLIILVIIVILFGPSRLAKTMGELGHGLRAFKDGLSDPSEEKPKE